MKASNKWGKREEYIAEVLNIKRQAMSGAGLFDKEDFIGHGITWQLKSTEGDSIRVLRQDVQKLYQHSKNTDSVFLLDYVNGPLLLCMTLDQLVNVVYSLLQGNVIGMSQKQEEKQEESMDISLDEFL